MLYTNDQVRDSAETNWIDANMDFLLLGQALIMLSSRFCDAHSGDWPR